MSFRKGSNLIRHFFWFTSAFLFAVILAGCKHHDEPNPTPTVLVSSTMTREFLASDFQLLLGISGFNLAPSSLKYSVVIYKIRYNTSLNGKMVVGSGLVAIPETNNPVAMLSFQHGTMVVHNEAPSVLTGNSPDLILYSALASPGFIAVIPDYLGFGSSSDVLHPYYVKEAMATAGLDMIRAAGELAVLKKINFNSKLFLAGYSEGGYATMAMHQALEKKGISGFTLVASFPAAGGYDVKGMQKYLFGLSTYDEPFFIAYVALAYQHYYDWKAPLSDFFQEPYATRIPDLFDGSKDGPEINSQLTPVVSQLITTDLIANIDTDNRYQYIAAAFNENSLLDWKPSVKMFLYHGDADTTVPIQNSVDTYNQMIANGASQEIVSLTVFPGKTHETGVQPYIEAIIPKIISMQ